MPWRPPQRAGATVPVWAGYSLKERDRRWNAVRANAAKAGLNCVFVPLGNGTDGRYLTQLRCSSMVLATDGREPIIIADRSSRNEWAPEPWQTSRQWAEPMAEALLEAGMERARIGVVGLKGGKVTHVRSPDGVVNHTALAEVMRRLPNAKFEDATDVVGFVRYVKSDEEISNLRRAAEIAEAGIEEMVRQARAGVDAAVFYAAVVERMLESGSEYFPLAFSIGTMTGLEGNRYTNPPIGRRLKEKDLIVAEVNAIWGAELIQEVQPILLGLIPDEWRALIELQREIFYAGLKFMRPGVSFGDWIDLVDGLGKERGIKAKILMHGCGYGDDGPIVDYGPTRESVRELRIEKGNAFVWKPCVISADGRSKFVWGGSVVVEDKGAEPLFKRSHGMISIL